VEEVEKPPQQEARNCIGGVDRKEKKGLLRGNDTSEERVKLSARPRERKPYALLECCRKRGGRKQIPEKLLNTIRDWKWTISETYEGLIQKRVPLGIR